jgi:transcriptional regulator with XRE-family HTH domain
MSTEETSCTDAQGLGAESITDNSTNKRFGQALRRQRRVLKLTQDDLADRSGLHRTYISELERGIRNPSLLNIEKLAEALELSLVELFKMYEEEQL